MRPAPARWHRVTDKAVIAAADRHGADRPGLDPTVGARG
jgi:hypothetical protein